MTEMDDYPSLKFQNNELINEIKSNNEKHFWTIEYQCIISQFTKYVGLYFLVFVVYLGIQGFLLVWIVGSHDDITGLTTELTKFLINFSKVCVFLFFICTFVALAIVNKLSKRKKKALSNLGFEVEDEFSIGIYATFIYIVFNIGLYYILCNLK